LPKPDRYLATGVESEAEPGSGGRVLRNLRGIRSLREMQHAESRALLVATERWITRTSPDHRFTAADIRAMHASWLGELYPWAGEYRTVDVSKPDIRFANARQIHRLMSQLESGALARYTPCRPATRSELAEALATVHAELVLIHPFREGNGRCARLLAMLMGLQAGLPALRFGVLGGRFRPRYFAAIHAALASDYAPLQALFVSAIERTERAVRRSS
jgi:cell filamentation protein